MALVYSQDGATVTEVPDATAPQSQTPAAPDTTEADGSKQLSTPNPSAPIGPMSYDKPIQGIPEYKMPPIVGSDGKGVVASTDAWAALKSSDKAYGINNVNVGKPDTAKTPPAASAVDNAKTTKASQGLDTDHPTAASQDPSKNIHDALIAADPQAIGMVLKKALQSMIMLKMMDKLTSPAGILSMTSGGIGGALQGLAGAHGLTSMLGALNSVMPNLSVSGLLTASATNSLHTGMMGMINNVAVGALAATEIAAAVSTSQNINAAVNAINAGAAGAIDAVAAFGGPAFGLVPGSLAAKIALVGPSGYLNTSQVIGGVRINTSVLTSPNPHLTQNIPFLVGDEHIAIATAAVSDIAGTLSTALGVTNPIGQSLAVVSHIAGNVSDITAGIGIGAIPGIASGAFTHTTLGGIINGGIAGIIDGGLNKILGSPLSGLLNNVSKLLPQIGGNITSSLSNLSASGANVNNLTKGLTNATKAMSLSKAAHNVAQNIFGEARAESIANAVNATANLAAAVNGQISMVTAFGDKIISAPENVAKSIVQAGTQVVVGNGTRLV